MKYLKMSLSYSNSRFWYLLLVSVIPAILIAFLASPYSTIDFLCNYSQQNISSFGSIYESIMGFNLKMAWIGIIGIFVVPFALSILMGAIDRHMRMGEFSLGIDRIVSRLNYNFITALKLSLVALFVYEVDIFLQAIVYFASAKIFVPNVALTINIIWYFIMVILAYFVYAMIIIWVPTMIHTGLNSTKAFSLSIRQVSKILPSIVVILLLPSIPMFIFMVIDSCFHLGIGFALDAIIIAIMFVYYTILMYTIFYDINGIERQDLKKEDIWKKSY